MIAEDETLSGMGTTLVAAIVADEEATLVNVGDSRGYHITDGGIEKITRDHSLVQQLVDEGEITSEEAETHPQRNVITQALGTDSEVDEDIYTVDLQRGLLLCSDGLTEEVTETRIAEIVSSKQPLAKRAEILVETANENGGSDNISVALTECG